MTDLKNALSLLSFLKSLRITYFSHLLRFIETNLNEFTLNASNLICQKINIDHICINCWLPVYKKSILEKQVASKINGVV